MSTLCNAGQFLTFSLRGQPYAVPIGTVREINRVSDITAVPQTPEFVAGVMNLRGKVIPVVNLRVKLGLERTDFTKETCIIVIETDGGQVGMIVDAVKGVIELQEAQIEPSPSFSREDTKSFVMGMGKLENEVVVLLDIVGCLAKEQLGKVATAAAA